jgi:5-methylcytosine-specific restriction protein A
MRNARFERKTSKGKDFRSVRNRRIYDFEWQAYSRRYLKRHPICYCDRVRIWYEGIEGTAAFGPPGAVAPAAHTDHVQPINGGGDKWDPANHQALCHSCHSKKTAKWG